MNTQKSFIPIENQKKAFKEICHKIGFKRQTIHVPELNIASRKQHLFWYWEDSNVFRACNLMSDIFDMKKTNRKEEKIFGYCKHPHVIDLPSVVAHFIMIDRCLDENNYIYTRGHEYGHLFWCLQETEPIYKQAKSPDYLRQSIKDSEDFACLCGYIALYNENLSRPSDWNGEKRTVNKIIRMKKNFDEFFLG
ncbi:MAG: hypothetical protein PHU71_07610 [Candidatus Gracilibacteria bacterium]|nr:hypothetical protein [Candidatus Gracilibacteria bacterium]